MKTIASSMNLLIYPSQRKDFFIERLYNSYLNGSDSYNKTANLYGLK
jgi:hypothetical protein